MKHTTELVFILDRSGSMSGLETDTIGGFNSMITADIKRRNCNRSFSFQPVEKVQQNELHPIC